MSKFNIGFLGFIFVTFTSIFSLAKMGAAVDAPLGHIYDEQIQSEKNQALTLAPTKLEFAVAKNYLVAGNCSGQIVTLPPLAKWKKLVKAYKVTPDEWLSIIVSEVEDQLRRYL